MFVKENPDRKKKKRIGGGQDLIIQRNSKLLINFYQKLRITGLILIHIGSVYMYRIGFDKE